MYKMNNTLLHMKSKICVASYSTMRLVAELCSSCTFGPGSAKIPSSKLGVIGNYVSFVMRISGIMIKDELD